MLLISRAEAENGPVNPKPKMEEMLPVMVVEKAAAATTKKTKMMRVSPEQVGFVLAAQPIQRSTRLLQPSEPTGIGGEPAPVCPG